VVESSHQNDDYRLTFEQSKWADEARLRQQEIDLKSKEIELKAKEQENTNSQLLFSQKEAIRNRWATPLVVAVFAAAVVAGGNATVALLNGSAQRYTEQIKDDQALILESIKANSDPDKAAENLQFLVETALISNPERRREIDTFLKTRKQGEGPALPSANPGPVSDLLTLTDPKELKRDPEEAGLYRRLTSIAKGRPTSQCVANPSASNVQLFDNGWMLIRRDKLESTVYTIFKTEDPGTVRWLAESDQSTGVDVSCPALENGDLIHYGFRWMYCSGPPELRMRLGKPITGEIPAWVQFQEWSKGLLVYGVPGAVATDKVVLGVPTKEAFLQLDGFFLETSEAKDQFGFRNGSTTNFDWHNETRNVYCTALWYPAVPGGNYMSTDLSNRPDCAGIKASGQGYFTPRPRCNISGFD
jgi:hypothetical protein